MKKFIRLSLLLLAAAPFITSCSKSDDTGADNQDKGNPAFMTIKFDNPPTRAVGVPTDESKITEGTILVFRAGSGILDGMQTFTDVTNPIQVKITAGTRDVYVIANTGINFTPVQNVTDLNNYTSKYALSTIKATGAELPMSGSALAQNATAATLTSPAIATVNMQFMCSKVTIAWTLTPNADLISFVATDAFLMNVPSSTDCFAFGTDNLTKYSTAFSTGARSFTSFTSGAYYPAIPYTNAYTANLELSDITANGSGKNYFYIFENSVVASPTIVTIQGTVSDNGVLTTYYYPIVINGAQNTSSGDGTATVIRGQSYLVTATIKGFGNTNPYDPITNAAMNVTIIPASWSPVININETFN